MNKPDKIQTSNPQPATLDEAASALDEIDRLLLEAIQGGFADGNVQNAVVENRARLAYHY